MPVEGLALSVLDDDIVIKVDGSLGLGAGIMTVGRGQRFVSQYFAHNFIMTRFGIKQDLGSGMPELVWGEADACLIPEGLFDLPTKARAIFGFAVSSRK